ncbi:Hrp-dependent type III effector protein [Xaviernesmea oryzae]|uniref:Hrp-dependent type III effector protein n=1 Tax=Xaviernesmea oryzae TaxID=464029 RepID=A0A1Q9B0Z8_9HYPH|nr:four-carbon acid sugar kinase family protein [Xaviernesmea oryzae]OLP61647.1 Hrp-dependent type III effector protein [Xaviernesmea oryzae]SEL04679.1 Uncharacterized conserved protein YgbK, DUF1537 family [Xaviernesmea oryzae]
MLAILADDLTGALDAAAPFAGRGLHTEVVLRLEAIGAALDARPAVLSINLDCREVAPAVARLAMETALAALPDDVLLFKKVDSRLKGNIAAELDAVPFRRALVAPAIPAFGRVVHQGFVQGFGVETPIAVRAQLGVHADRCHIPDVASDEAMRAVLEEARRDGADLLIGARGLSEALAQAMTGKAQADPVDLPKGAALFVIGSRDPITLAQIDALTAARDIELRLAPNGDLGPETRQAPSAQLTLVQAVPGAEACAPEAVAERLAASVVPGLTEGAATWLLSGGATAQAVLLKAGLHAFRLRGECLPGLGVAEAQGRCIIAKSGGFGHAGTLTEIASRLQ